ncbi:MAG: PEP-CTERM sorting domain-containing protein [Deltaproteobacteria bacterium]|nr:PEP-CTERM sorting domain-containing protein [Deltaproteobacteria bacterium]MBW2698648.1 PEP-CTERM sorting domain-containing protein [Deltaproteobacteria bacterium]
MHGSMRRLVLIAALLLPAPAWAIGSVIDAAVTSASTSFTPTSSLRVRVWNALINRPNNGVSEDLNDSGLPSNNADFTFAFERTEKTLAPGESMSSLTQFGYSTQLLPPTVVPTSEPGTGILMGLGLIGLAYSGKSRAPGAGAATPPGATLIG